MSINYRYEIINVDEQARCMEIVYSADGHPTQHVGSRIPYDTETLESVIRTMAPVVYWESLQLNIVPPTIGTSGEIRAADEAAAAAAAVAAEAAAANAQSQPVVVGSQNL
jgi:hypothetical protein